MKKMIGCKIAYLTDNGFEDAGNFKFDISELYAISIVVYYNKEMNHFLHKIFRHKQYIKVPLPPYRIKERKFIYSRIFKGTFYKYTRLVSFSANIRMQVTYQ